MHVTYDVVCVDTSDVVTFMPNDIRTDNWMDDVEKLTRQMQPILRISRDLIGDARFEIEHMPKLKKVGQPSKAARGDYSSQGSA